MELTPKYEERVRKHLKGETAWMIHAVIRELRKMQARGTLTGNLEEDVETAFIIIEEKSFERDYKDE